MDSVARIDPDEVFNIGDASGVEFEIAFTALISTLTLSTSQPTQSPVLNVFAILLLLLTILRRMAVSNELVDLTHILRGSRGLVLPLSYVLLISQLNILSQAGSRLLPIISPTIVLFTTVILLFVVWIIIQEILFADLSIYLSVICNNAAYTAQDTVFKPLTPYFQDMTRRFLSYSVISEFPGPLSNIEPKADTTPRNQKYVLIFLLISTPLVFGFGGIGLSILSGDLFSSIVVFISAFFIQYPVDFLYSRYGAVGFYTNRSGWDMFATILFGSLLVILFVQL